MSSNYMVPFFSRLIFVRAGTIFMLKDMFVFSKCIVL